MAKSIPELQAIAKRVRRDIVEMITAAKSGHPGGSLSAVEIVVELYFNHMRIDPANPKKGEGLMRRLAVGADPVAMLDAALAEAAAAAGVGLTVEDNALFLSYEPE